MIPAQPAPPVRNSLAQSFVPFWGDEAALPATGENGEITDRDRARRLMQSEIALDRYVFTGENFPGVSRAARENLEALVGPHTLAVAYYDRHYNPATAAAAPGRYGAVVTVTPENGRATRRFHTLYRAPESFAWFRDAVPAQIALPAALGVHPQVQAAQGETVAHYLRGRFADALRRDENSAVLLAGLAETPPDDPPATGANDVWARDRQWWLGLKRKLYGSDKQFAEPFTANAASPPAPVLRPGAEADAGMVAGTAAKLDALCREWAENSDQAFAVTIARRAVVFFENAYGARDGRPMTRETGSFLASISKLLAGTFITMLADAGRIDLHRPISDYLPALRGVSSEKPITLRHLMTHTAGLWEHWGDEQHDFEERVADYLPFLEVGRRYEYNGASFALAGKIIENVTGEALPVAFERYLLAPLGMTRTDVRTMSWSTFSTSGDMARLGQMLLNKGAYGDRRFFRPDALSLLLPRRLTDVLGPDTEVEYGLGTSWFRGEGLGDRTFGHGAASAATLRIDPENDLVVVMTRNDAGRSFDQYHPRFLRTVAEGISR